MMTEVRGWSRRCDGKSLRAAVAAAALVLALALSLGGVGAQEAWAVTATGGAKVHKLKPFATYTKYDITGDGVRDKIEIYPTTLSEDSDLVSDLRDPEEQEEGEPFDKEGAFRDVLRLLGRGSAGGRYGYSALYVYVNDELAYRKVGIEDGATSDSLEAYLITLKNGSPHLFLATRSNGDSAKVCGVFSYQRGKLRQTLNDKNFIPKKYVSGGRTLFLSKVSGNKIILRHQMNLRMVGAMLCDVPYAYKAGKFVRQGTTFKPRVGMPLRYGKAHKALKSLTAYKNVSCKSKKFTIKKGQKVKFAKLYVKGSRIALQVKVGKKTGWIKCASTAKSSLLAKSSDPWVPRMPPFKGLQMVG